MSKPKIDQLWERVFELADNEDTSGRLNFDDGATSGRLVVALDGTEYGVEISPLRQGAGPGRGDG